MSDVRQYILLLSKIFRKNSQGSKNIINSSTCHFLVCGHPNWENAGEEMLVSELIKLRRR